MTAPDAVLAADALGRVHFVGVGGAGMSGIARIMLARGVPVSGCDARDSRTLAALRARGADVSVGHDPEHLTGVDTLVVTSAVRSANAEVVAAQERGVRVIPRAAALASVMVGRRGIAIAGTHGKTTTTSMVAVALQACGRDPSYAIGGDLNEPGSNAHAGTGEYFVAEADESDRSFLLLAPELAVVTNIEADHLDNYADAEDVHAAFESFVRGLPADGCLVLGVDDPGARSLVDAARERGLRIAGFGMAPDADVRVEGLELDATGSRFQAVAGGRRLGEVVLQVPGRYNALNAAGAIAVGLSLGLPFSDMVRGLAAFTGARRRFELKGVAGGVRVFDDYAHHPTEVRELLTAAREVAAGGRLVAVFQPHLYSRTQMFASQFGEALALADLVVVMEVYAAREDPVPGVTGALVADAVPLDAEHVRFVPSWSSVADLVAGLVQAGDIVLTIGAGDVTLLGSEILAAVDGVAAGGERVES